MGERLVLRRLHALVLGEMMSAAEPHGADFAVVGLLALVNQHVGLELVGVREARVAEFARVWPFTRVDP